MNDGDQQQFRDVLAGALEVYGRDLSPAAWEIWWRMMAPYSIDQFRQSITAHLSNSVYPPKPADVVAWIRQSDGRPGSNEAWELALSAMDEDATVVWNHEIAQAKSAADPIWAEGDKVGARMAFKDRYERIVREARECGDPVKWRPSLGRDKAGHAPAIRQAVEMGRLLPDSVHVKRIEHLEDGGQTPLIAGSVAAKNLTLFPD